MKLNRKSSIKIAKSKKLKGNINLEPLDYQKWINFIDAHSEIFTWKENTKDGIQILQEIDKVPIDFKERVLASLNKTNCYQEFDKRKGYYNIHIGFSRKYNWISIDFERTPKISDLNIFKQMADLLGANLIVNDSIVIDDKILTEIT